jgi:amidase
MMGHIAARLEEIARLYKRSVARRQVELQNYALGRIGRRFTALDFVHAKSKWRKFGYTFSQFQQQYDLLLTPTLGQPPVLVGSQEPKTTDKIIMKLLSTWVGRPIQASRGMTNFIMKELIKNAFGGQMPFTLIANLTGLPAMSVPLHWTDSGLPCGVQFIGRFGDEATLLRLAAQLERAHPWSDKKPKICS